MATERVKLEVQERSQRGSAANRRLRKQGLVPGVLYGSAFEPRAFAVPEAELRHALTGAHGSHAILDVVVGDEKKPHSAILKDYQRHPVKGDVVHVDLHVIRLDRAIQSSVSIVLTGESPGAKAGGVVTSSARDLNVEALPTEIPDQIEVDVSSLDIGDLLHLSDLKPPEGVVFLDEPETLLVSVTLPSLVVEEVEEEEEGEEGEEGEGEAAEGESPAGEAEAPSE
ncbi:MAG: 50S ribosomal protein L25 [Gaiellaceae bacterium]